MMRSPLAASVLCGTWYSRKGQLLRPWVRLRSPSSVGSIELDGILNTSMQKQRITSAMMKAMTMASMFSLSQTPKESGFRSVFLVSPPLLRGGLRETSSTPRTTAGAR